MMPSDRTGAGYGRPEPSAEEVSGEATLDRAAQTRIGEQLRAMYDGLMDQPVPDRFHALLARLENGGDRKGTG